jgi:hypothetical protein
MKPVPVKTGSRYPEKQVGFHVKHISYQAS